MTLTANISDEDRGGSIIVAAEYFVDKVGEDSAGMAMASIDDEWDSSTEDVRTLVDVSTWEIGSTHILYVHGKDAAGNWGAVDSVTVNVTPLPEPDINLSDTHHNYRDVRVDTTSDWTLRITNEGTADLRIADVVSNKPTIFWIESPVFPATVAPSEDIDVTVRFKPPSVGEVSGELTITSNDPDEGTLKVALNGNGIPGRLAFLSITPSDTTVATGEMVQFSASGYDSAGNPKTVTPTWNVSDPKLGMIDETGLFTAGKVSISGFVVASVGSISDTASVTVMGIEPEIVYNYPNPAKGDETTFRYYLNYPAEVSIQIFDLSREFVDEISVTTTGRGYGEVKWDLSRIAPGVYIYLFKAKYENGKVVGPITKKALVIR